MSVCVEVGSWGMRGHWRLICAIQILQVCRPCLPGLGRKDFWYYLGREPPVLGTPPSCQKIRTWRFVEKTFRPKKCFKLRFVMFQTKVCHVRVTVDLPTFCLVTIFSVESKELELELGQPKKKTPSLYLSKNLENTYRKILINMST